MLTPASASEDSGASAAGAGEDDRNNTGVEHAPAADAASATTTPASSNSRGPAGLDPQEALKDQSIGPFPDYGGCELKLVNMTATANMGCPIDLKTVVTRARNAEYNPKRFSACVVRLINSKEPKATALIFKTGKVVVTGAKSEAAVNYACSRFASILGKLEAAAGGPSQNITFDRTKDIKVQNMVATTDLGFAIRLEGLQTDHSAYINYEPELFPGLIYRLAQPKICLLIFVSGKVVLTGAKSSKDLEEAFKVMYPLLSGFKKDSVLSLKATAPAGEPPEGQAHKRQKT